MMIIQFQVTNTAEDEKELIPDFCQWLCDQIFIELNTLVNRRKIQLRLAHLNEVSWITWLKVRYLDTQSIMEAIYESLVCRPQKNNVWKIEINSDVKIPGTLTSINRLVRFINYGDNKTRGTGMFTSLIKKFNFQKLNMLWKIYMTKELGIMSEGLIISNS